MQHRRQGALVLLLCEWEETFCYLGWMWYIHQCEVVKSLYAHKEARIRPHANSSITLLLCHLEPEA